MPSFLPLVLSFSVMVVFPCFYLQHKQLRCSALIRILNVIKDYENLLELVCKRVAAQAANDMLMKVGMHSLRWLYLILFWLNEPVMLLGIISSVRTVWLTACLICFLVHFYFLIICHMRTVSHLLVLLGFAVLGFYVVLSLYVVLGLRILFSVDEFSGKPCTKICSVSVKSTLNPDNQRVVCAKFKLCLYFIVSCQPVCYDICYFRSFCSAVNNLYVMYLNLCCLRAV